MQLTYENTLIGDFIVIFNNPDSEKVEGGIISFLS